MAIATRKLYVVKWEYGGWSNAHTGSVMFTTEKAAKTFRRHVARQIADFLGAATIREVIEDEHGAYIWIEPAEAHLTSASAIEDYGL